MSNCTASLNAYKDSDIFRTRMELLNIIWGLFLHFRNINILNFLSIVLANASNLSLSEHVHCFNCVKTLGSRSARSEI